jgi:hypothetical protein
LSQMAFSNSFLTLLLRPFIMICESMLYPWVRMDYYEKCWQYQNIDYRYFDYIYLRPLQSLTCLACVAGPQFYGGLICNGQDFGGHGGGLRACWKDHLWWLHAPVIT